MAVEREIEDGRRFAWGENWSRFAGTLTDEQVREAELGILELLDARIVAGARFLDIGTGSGLHSAAAQRLGVGELTAVDYDPTCVATAERVLAERATAPNWRVFRANILEPEGLEPGAYDIVYSWGVLHHTGDMWKAIGNAATLVRPGGRLCIAIYTKTAFCGFWKVAKRIYLALPSFLQRVADAAFVVWCRALAGAARLLRGRNPFAHEGVARGQREWIDAADWLGGYPYESASADEIRAFLEPRGFTLETERLVPGRRIGLAGSGCDEYVFVRDA